MAQEIFYTNYQLYRTTPKLSGNMKWDLLVVPGGDGRLEIIDFHLRPISNYIPFVLIADEDILTRPHQFNIKKFAESCKGHFYDYSIDPALDSDWPIVMASGATDADFKYLKTWDDTYWAGTQRISNNLYGNKSFDGQKYSFTHECLIPMWIEICDKLTIKLSLGPSKEYELVLVEPVPKKKYSYHERFCKYFFDYLKYVGIDNGNPNCLNVDFRNSLTTIYGLDINSGNVLVRHDYNVVKNLTYRERPLLESNSLLTNIYRDTNMILPQLFNFNIVFNPAELADEYDKVGYIVSTSSFISYLGTTDPKVGKRDLFTNHHFIPRIQTQYQPISGVVTKPDLLRYQHINSLDYLQDYRSSEMMHKNKIVQPICHWCVSTHPDMLFNVYDGFGTCFVDGQGNLLGKRDHIYGSQADSAITEFDQVTPNDDWTGKMIYGDGALMDKILDHAGQYIKGFSDPNPLNGVINEDYLLSLSGYINGNKFNYTKQKDTDPDDIYVGLMKCPPYNENDTPHPSDTWKVLESSRTTGIFSHFYNHDGKDVLTEIANSANNIYDVGEFHDMDNRYLIGSGGIVPAAAYRDLGNVYGLYVGMSRNIVIDSNGEPKDILAVIFWAEEIFLPDGSTRNGLTYKEKRPQELVLGYILKAVQGYVNYYKDKLPENRWDDNLNNLSLLNDALHTLQVPDVIYFDRTITPKNDISLSIGATEIEYVKDFAVDKYVYRYSESIKPAMYLPAAIRCNDYPYMQYANRLGRNFLWHKDIMRGDEILDFSKSYNKYAISGISPVYPSMDYDSVNRVIIDTKDRFMNPAGDLMYDEPLLIFDGRNIDGTSDDSAKSTKWCEYKWFDKSRIVTFPLNNGINGVRLENKPYNDVDRLKADVLEIFSPKDPITGQPKYDYDYLDKIYDITYEIQHINRVENSDDILYTYQVYMKLK